MPKIFFSLIKCWFEPSTIVKISENWITKQSTIASECFDNSADFSKSSLILKLGSPDIGIFNYCFLIFNFDD